MGRSLSRFRTRTRSPISAACRGIGLRSEAGQERERSRSRLPSGDQHRAWDVGRHSQLARPRLASRRRLARPDGGLPPRGHRGRPPPALGRQGNGGSGM